MKKILTIALGLLMLAGCSSVPVNPPRQGEKEGWQTYEDTVRGFSLSYPASTSVDITSTPVDLPQAVGGKERQIKVDVMAEGKTETDNDGCLVWEFTVNEGQKILINDVPFCLTVVDEGAAGSTYRTYHYTTRLKNALVADIAMTIRFPTSVRVYGGCENDADQTKQACMDYAFDEARDTALFKEILNTFAE